MFSRVLALGPGLLVADASITSRDVFETPDNFSTAIRRQTPPVVAYSGPEASFPLPDSWLSYDALFDANSSVCDNSGKGDVIKSTIRDIGALAGIDDRVILAIVLQESNCVLSNNFSLMGQSRPVYDGTDESITNMIREGTIGSVGIATFIRQFHDGVFTGLRAYNSGAIGVDEDDLSSIPAGTGVPSYCSDIANRLRGAIVASL